MMSAAESFGGAGASSSSSSSSSSSASSSAASRGSSCLQCNNPDPIPCSFCGSGVCGACQRVCVSCQDVFCGVCSTLNYDHRDTRVFCLDCNAAEVAAASKRRAAAAAVTRHQQSFHAGASTPQRFPAFSSPPSSNVLASASPSAASCGPSGSPPSMMHSRMPLSPLAGGNRNSPHNRSGSLGFGGSVGPGAAFGAPNRLQHQHARLMQGMGNPVGQGFGGAAPMDVDNAM